MLNIVALICALSTPMAECSRATATDVLPLRRQVATPIECAVSGMEQIAETGIVVPGESYLKIACERPRQAAQASGR